MIITEMIRGFVGDPYPGFEFLEYIMAASFFLMLMKFITNIFNDFSRMFKGR